MKKQYISRTLTSTERNYSQIAKAVLAKFHKMSYGHTDYKPLVSIFSSKKDIPVYRNNCLQRWVTMLLDYNLSIKYQSSKNIGQAEALSRLISLNRKIPEDIVVAAVAVEPEIVSALVATVRALLVTPEMVLRFHSTNWPTMCADRQLQPFFQRGSSLSEVSGTILFGERVVVPLKLQNRIHKQFHYGQGRRLGSLPIPKTLIRPPPNTYRFENITTFSP